MLGKEIPTITDWEKARTVTIEYHNHRGEDVVRHIRPASISFMATRWHPEAQWILHALNVDRNVERSFAIKDIKSWKVG